MKKLILILCLSGITAAYAQQVQPKQPVQRPAKPVTIVLPDSSNLVELQQILMFSYQWLQKSKAPADDVEQVRTAIQQLYPSIVPMKKEEPIRVPPAKKSGQ